MHMFGIMLAGAKPVAWPGTDISGNRISEEGYVITVSNAYDRIIFNRTNAPTGEIKQTIDITIPSSQDMTFVSGGTSGNKLNGSWSNLYVICNWSGKYGIPATPTTSHTH